MAIATDAQVQSFIDTRIRKRCEQIRALYLSLKDDKTAFDDVYANLTQQSPTFLDGRSDVPEKATPNTVLAWDTFAFHFIALIEGTLTDQNKNTASGVYNEIVSLCVRPVIDQ